MPLHAQDKGAIGWHPGSMGGRGCQSHDPVLTELPVSILLSHGLSIGVFMLRCKEAMMQKGTLTHGGVAFN